MNIFRLYGRVLALLGAESLLAWVLTLANVTLASAQFAELSWHRQYYARVGSEGEGGDQQRVAEGLSLPSPKSGSWHAREVVMLTRRGFAGFASCAICAAMGLVASDASAADGAPLGVTA